jgi:hypothetical protein
LITGGAPTKEEVPSPEAVRINMERLNEIDKYFIGQMFADIAKEPSPLAIVASSHLWETPNKVPERRLMSIN